LSTAHALLLLTFNVMNRSVSQCLGRKAHALGVLFVLVLAMLLRSLVPAGYMPNPRAAEHGNSLFVFCSPGGTESIPPRLLELWADVAPAPDESGMDDPCPFGVLGQLAIGMPELREVAAMPLIFAVRPSPPINDPALPGQGPRGPPLGSRAPPFLVA